jgi:tetratricopeptide (TPR) repeat protein
MDRVIDLTDSAAESAAVLTETATGGFLGSKLLSGAPLGSYLDGDEDPRYVARNKTHGLAVAGEGPLASLRPDDDYQAFLLVTDRRIIVVAGAADGDRHLTLELQDVVQASARSTGLRESTLRIETDAGQTLAFACRANLRTVAAAIDDAAQSWAGALRRLEEVAADLGDARDHIGAGEYNRAVAALAGVGNPLDSTLSVGRRLGPGAAAYIEPRVDAARRTLELRRRLALAGRAGTRHAAGQDAWNRGAFETAAEEYDRAVEDYEAALETPGLEPSDAALLARLRGAVAEREILRVGPVVAAETARERAQACTDPEAAAEAWETTIDRLHAALGLTWPTGGSFAIDSADLRERAAAASEAAIEARRETARRWLAAGDRIAARGHQAEAIQAYERARPHLDRALELAEELFPQRVRELERAVGRLEDRVAGEGVPDDAVPVEAPMPAALVERLDLDAVTDVASLHSAPRAESEDSSPADGEPATEATAADEGSDAASPTVEDPVDVATLESLDAAALRELVADLWAAEGWSTEQLSVTARGVYDVVGERGDPPERVLVWVVPRAEAESVGAPVVEGIATTRDRAETADRAALVTTGRLRMSARRAASDSEVTVLDREALADRLVEAGLAVEQAVH